MLLQTKVEDEKEEKGDEEHCDAVTELPTAADDDGDGDGDDADISNGGSGDDSDDDDDGKGDDFDRLPAQQRVRRLQGTGQIVVLMPSGIHSEKYGVFFCRIV